MVMVFCPCMEFYRSANKIKFCGCREQRDKLEELLEYRKFPKAISDNGPVGEENRRNLEATTSDNLVL